jgi:hypothetical protein
LFELELLKRIVLRILVPVPDDWSIYAVPLSDIVLPVVIAILLKVLVPVKV